MKLRHSQRTQEGFKAEDSTARQLRRRGHRVVQKPKNEKNNDMNVDGKRVEVKAVTETEYKGSDGYPIKGFVFSNMKKNPKTDKYILKCLSNDRTKTLKEYHIPAGKVKQKTLTITPNGKYSPFEKKGHLQPFRKNDVPFQDPAPRRRKKSLRGYAFEASGFVGGAAVGLGLGRVADIVMYTTGNSKSLPEDVSFKEISGAVIGGALGRHAGKTIGEHHDQKRIRRKNLR